MITLKPHNLLKHEITIDNVKGLFISGLKAAFAIAIAPISPITSTTLGLDSLVEFWKSIGLRNNLGGQAFRVMTDSYFVTVGRVIKGYMLIEEKTVRMITDKVSKANVKIDAQYDLLNLATFPLTQTPLFKDFQKATRDILLSSELSKEHVPAILEEIQSQFTLLFGHHLWETRNKYKDFYSWFYDVVPPEVRNPLSAVSIKNLKVAIRNNCLRPLEIAQGTPYPERFTLGNIYVEPSATVNIDSEPNHAASIVKLLLQLMDTSSPIMIHGDPGHGKTSFAKIFGSMLLDDRRDILPIYIEFNTIPGDIPFADYLKRSFGSWLDRTFFLNNRTVFIIDGIDEAQVVEGRSAFVKIFDGIINFIENVNNEISEILSTSIFTGRTNFIDSYKMCFPEKTIYVRINDLNRDQQKQWIDNFVKVTQVRAGNKPTVKRLQNLGLGEFIGQPVLLTIICIMFLEKEGMGQLKSYPGRDYDKADIYDRIIGWTYERKWGPKRINRLAYSIPSLSDYYAILQTVAISIYSRGTRSIKDSELFDIFETRPDLLKSIRGLNIQELIERTMISFHFKSATGRAYEFSHKSIEDYLVSLQVKSVLTELKRFCDHYYKYEETVILPSLFELFGNRAMESAHGDFLELTFKRWDDEEKREIFEILDKVWLRIARDRHISFDQHLLKGIARHNGAVNFALSILHVLSRLHFVIQASSSNQDIEYWSILGSTSDPDAFAKFIDFIDSSEQRCFASSGLKLRYVDLSDASLSMKALDSVNFSFSRFRGSDFRRSSLEGAVFRDADLEDANFRYCNMKMADLSGANTRGVLTAGTDLDSCIVEWNVKPMLDIVKKTSKSDKKKVMLIDDEPRITAVMREMLVSEADYAAEHYIDEFVDPKDALDEFRKEEYDIVITGYMMPGLTGIDLLREIKNLRPRVPVILMTGNTDHRIKNRAMHFGASDFLLKPFHVAEFLETVRKAL